MMGVAKGALEAATAYSHEREAFGQKIADFQAMQHQRAQLATEIEAGSLMVYNAARMKDHGMNFVKEAAMAKYYCSEVHIRCFILSLSLVWCFRWPIMWLQGVLRSWVELDLLKITQLRNSTGILKLVGCMLSMFHNVVRGAFNYRSNLRRNIIYSAEYHCKMS